MSTLDAFRQKSLQQQGRVAGNTIGARKDIARQKAQTINNIPQARTKPADKFVAKDKPVSDRHRTGNEYKGNVIRNTRSATAPAYRHQRVQNIHEGTSQLMQNLPKAPVTDDQRLAFLDTIISTPALHTSKSLRNSAQRFASKAQQTGAVPPRKAATKTNPASARA